MRTLDIFFKSSEKASEKVFSSRPISKSSLLLSPSQPFSEITQDSLFSTNNLHIRLEEINKQCLLLKSVKENEKIFIYDYLRRLNICRFIQLLLNEQGKMDASNNIAQIMWNKGDYMARCIRKWGVYFIKTGELLAYRQ